MATKWLEVIHRIPVIFLLDFSLSFLPEYFSDLKWFGCIMLQSVFVLVSLCILVSSTDQLSMMYYYAILLVHLTVTLYLNVTNTPFLMEENVETTQISIFNYFLSLDIVPMSWIVYFMSIILYTFSLRSVKPLLMSIALMILMTKNFQGMDEASLYDSIAFGVAVFIILQTLYLVAQHFMEIVKYQIRILAFRYRMYGALVLFVLHWRRLNLNSVLSLYWVIMWNYQMVVYTIFVDERFHLSFVLACAANACNSFLKVASLCYVIQQIVSMLLKAVRKVVKDEHTFVEEGQHRPSGLRESVGFLFLSLYTNLTGSDASKRIVLIELIFLLLLSALIRSIFEIIEPYLLALNSVLTHSRKRHVYLVVSCLVLMAAALYMGAHLYRLREKVPFSIPNLITCAQIFCALLLYFLYKYDSHCGEIWEELDDYVYYIKGACRTFEFLLIVLVLGYRVLDTTSKWTIFQVIMVMLHLYVNVYLSLKDGWKSVQLRRLVHHKLNVLPKATAERLALTEDVCPICLEELKTARVTPCNHLFHMFCLKKWLNVQNKCPMCHSTILEKN